MKYVNQLKYFNSKDTKLSKSRLNVLFLDWIMYEYGVGHCQNGFYLGWDGKGQENVEDCKNVCIVEPQCTFAAFFDDGYKKGCARYEAETCQLVASTDEQKAHKTFLKKGLYTTINIL